MSDRISYHDAHAAYKKRGFCSQLATSGGGAHPVPNYDALDELRSGMRKMGRLWT